jgi:L-alanine-DL-glutamate epimerase-like enolase superfamily enzyme
MTESTADTSNRFSPGADITITDIRAFPVRSPRIAKTKNVLRDEALIVEVCTDAGISGWTEAHGYLPALKALVEASRPHPRDRGPRHALIGQNLSDLPRLVEAARASSVLSGRSGLGRVAIGAIETALFDVVGKVRGVPAWRLLPGAGSEPAQDSIVPYITIYNRGSYAEVVAKGKADIDRALDVGYRSFKLEATNYNTTDTEAITFVEEMRAHVGDDIELFVDNVYRWPDYESGLKAALRYAELGAAFLEDPFLPEQWELWRRLTDEVGLPLATGGGMEALGRFVASMELGGTAIMQPGVHITGLLGAHEVCQEVAKRGRTVTSFGVSATSLTASGQLHLAAANPVVTYVEYAPAELFPNLLLRTDVAGPEPQLVDGARFLAPREPGLGVECDREALATYMAFA